MKIVIRNIFGLVLGIVLGGVVNMGIVVLGPAVIPPPAGVDVTDPESIGASMHLYKPLHFVVPFLAHALGTLAGATIAYLIAASHRSLFAYLVGVAFLAGGISAAFMIPAPAWFIGADLLLAYLPMAWLGVWLGKRFSSELPSPPIGPSGG